MYSYRKRQKNLKINYQPVKEVIKIQLQLFNSRKQRLVSLKKLSKIRQMLIK